MISALGNRSKIIGFVTKTCLGVLRKIIPQKLRPYFDPIRKAWHGALRMVVPSVREQYRLDRMIGPLGYWKEMQEYQLNLLKKMGLKPYHTLLDIGCGPLSGGLAFIPYLDSGHYVGIDIRSNSIAEAHIQVAKAGLADKTPFLAVSSTFGRNELGDLKFDYVWASQIMYHFDPEKIESCLEQVSARLKPDAKFYADIISTPNMVTPDKRWFEFSFYFHSLEHLNTLSKKHGLTMSNLGKIEEFGYPVDWGFKLNYLLEFRKPK